MNQLRQSSFVTKTLKESKLDQSINSQLLIRAGYIRQLMAGVYTYLPLGYRVLSKIEELIRNEMSKLSSQEVLMPAIHPKQNWETTNRWDSLDVLFKIKSQSNKEFALGPTHEEIATPLIGEFISSYKDLPLSIFQIQTKFRDEPRAKSGLFRGREFRMKDLYSFHLSENDLNDYYQKVLNSYLNIFNKCGLADLTYLTTASGGSFSKYSHEFQTVSGAGEDTIYIIPDTKIAVNKEIIQDQLALKELLPSGVTVNDLIEKKAVEVGNIFKLNTKFSDAFKLNAVGKDNDSLPILMGCYGLGPSRLMGTIVESFNDENGIIWPEEIAPYQVHLISLVKTEDEIEIAEKLYNDFKLQDIQVLYDDRKGVTAGQKFAESDLIGIPNRLVISSRSIKNGTLELKKRSSKKTTDLSFEKVIEYFLN